MTMSCMFKIIKRCLLSSLPFLAMQIFAADWRAEVIPLNGTELNHPFGIVRGPDRCIYFCEVEGNVVRKIETNGTITTVAAGFNNPHELRFDKNGQLFVADTGNHRIVRVDLQTGRLTSITSKIFKTPISIQAGANGDIFVCEIGRNSIVRVNPNNGLVTPVMGDELEKNLKGPRSIDFDRSGNLWIVLRGGNKVLKFDPAARTLAEMAGTGETGFTGDGGPALLAALNGPKGISISPDGQRIFLADTENHVIRMIDLKTGNIELIWGTGKKGAGVNELSRPHALFAEVDGSLLVSDSDNNRLLVLRPSE
ncbi:MAG TPA: NHL repeat-containing protein [Pontiellaceae bacterium]|nr:NHL repeat-containing protein [Pontiellaceae bacterium]